MGGHQVVGLERPKAVNAAHPDSRIPKFGAPEGVDVGEGGTLQDFRVDQDVVFRQIDGQFIGCLAGHVHDIQGDAGNFGLQAVTDQFIGSDE